MVLFSTTSVVEEVVVSNCATSLRTSILSATWPTSSEKFTAVARPVKTSIPSLVWEAKPSLSTMTL